MKYKYNGIPIPLPKLPEWDKTIYPYAFIQHSGTGGSLDFYSLIVTTASGVMDDGYTIGEHTMCAWVVAANEATAEALSGAYPGISTKVWLQFEDAVSETEYSYSYVVWSDHTIRNADNSIYLLASDPVCDMSSFWAGVSMGLCGKAIFGKGEPVPDEPVEPIGYLYGRVAEDGETDTITIDGVRYVGMVLPKLPKWDTEKYPYAWIRSVEYSDGTVKYYLRVFSEPLVYRYDGFLNKKYVIYNPGSGILFDHKNDEWVQFGTECELGNYFPVDSFLDSWVNHDVISDEDDSVYQYATDPIPVYE